jgi:hypothetical protein
MDRPGIWRRGGLEGMVCGLDLGEAMTSLPPCDREFARELFISAESAFVAALLKREKSDG